MIGGGEEGIIHFDLPLFAIKLLKMVLDTDFIKTALFKVVFLDLNDLAITCLELRLLVSRAKIFSLFSLPTDF